MNNDFLKVPKQQKQVKLWVHPEGQVIGSIFLRKQSVTHAGPEIPLEVFNRPEPFIVFDTLKEVRFYNRKSIVRIEYKGKDGVSSGEVQTLMCSFQLMDGAFLSGLVEEQLHPFRSRLLDYLNKPEELFIKIHIDENTMLVNKSYINHVRVDSVD